MTATRLFPIFVILAIASAALPAAAVAAHGGGGGGGGGHSGGGWGGGGGHASYGAGMHYSAGYSSGAHYNAGSSGGNYIHYGNANLTHAGNANYVHSGNQNWSHNWSGQNANSWNHGNNWNNWGHNNWDHYFNHGYWGPGWGGWGWGWGWPWGIGLGWGWPYGPYYADYFSPYDTYYAGAYPASAYGYNYADEGPYAANPAEAPYVVASPQSPNTAEQLQPPPGDQQPASEALQYYNEGRSAFQQGNYRDALRLAGHAGVESRQNPKVYELQSLASFAVGDYLDAATAAHGALALDKPSTWAELYGYYNDNDKYTEQLRKLEKTVATVPNSAPAQFLLGYHYLMTGAKAEAKEHFAMAAKLTPKDKLAAHIVKQLNAGSEVTPPEFPKPPAAGTEPPKLPPPPQAKGQSL